MRLVHCRTGSLETAGQLFILRLIVHCRTGSLEIALEASFIAPICSLPHRQLRKVSLRTARKHKVHCRTGSLERPMRGRCLSRKVHCRTGSLEKTAALSFQTCLVHCRTGSLEIKPTHHHQNHKFTAAQVA